MATILSFLSGRQITDDDGEPVTGALLYHYQANTTNNLTVYSDQAGETAHAQPVVCDAGGFVPLIYISDASDWKVVIQTALGVTLKTYDNLPAAAEDIVSSNFAFPLVSWNQITSASSPLALTANDAGKAYEADTTGGNIEFDLPSAASVGNGRGFFFKKTASANSMIIDPNASETIDNVSTSLTIGGINTIVGIFSNGAEWYRVDGYLDAVQLGPLLPGLQSIQVFTSSGTWTRPDGIATILAIGTGPGGGGGTHATVNRQGPGGGAGATCIELIDVTATASVTVTIGTGGAGGASGGNAGVAGSGATTFGALFSAGAGGGGAVGATGTGGTGGTATGGSINLNGANGNGIDDAGGTSNSGSGAASFWGGGGASVGSGAGLNGVAPGSGGSGASSKTATAGGNGANGIVVVLEFGS